MLWKTLKALFWKDIHKVLRKPLVYAINICIPLFMTAVIGFVFSPSGGGNALGVIRMAIVDEDDSIVGEFLSGAVSNPEMQENMNLQIMDRETAMASILDSKISGILIIPEGFSDAYLLGEEVPPLELIKNPAHRYHPAVIEELLGVVVAGANAIYRVAGDDLADVRDIFEQEGVPDMTRIAGLAIRLGDRFEIAGDLLFPPLIQYDSGEAESEGEEEESTSFNLFGFILPGFAGLFLFFIADNVIRDIYREEKAGTLDRYRSFQGSLVPFIVSKVFLSIFVIAVSMLITFGAGMALFGIKVTGLLMMFMYTIVYSFVVTGFIVFINALAGKETRADAMNGVIIFSISFLGGNMVPASQMPAFITDNISSYLPNYWFIRGMHYLQFGWEDVSIAGYSFLMLALGFLFLYLGSRILHQKLESRRL